jgi:PAT family beta-lactamase induction signal transducer AmpG
LNESYTTKTWYFFFLIFPTGISQGFITIALPWVLKQHGFSVAAIAGIVALGLSANLWRFLWGPVVDMTLSLRKWYWISFAASSITLMLLCYIPYEIRHSGLLTITLFISQVAATFLMMPTTAYMAKCVPTNRKGSAGGWYQAGNLAGTGLGGGVGLWLAGHFSMPVTGMILCIVSLGFSLVIQLLKDIPAEQGKRLGRELVALGKDIIALVKIPLALLTILLICMPIGSGAAANLWSAIATDWKTDANTVALVTGIISGIVSTVGCVVGGIMVDRWGVWSGYLASGAVCAVVTIIMAILPMEPYVFIGGVLAYTFGLGLINAAFTAVILLAIGKKNAATKYALLSSFGNLPVVYMTAFNGWSHDHYNSRYMLLAEAVIGFAFILISLFIIRKMQSRKMLKTVDM